MTTSPVIDAWIAALLERHTAALTRPEFLKAVRALSARYVERRGELHRGSALASAGRRAAFAAFYAPLHFVTAGAVIAELGLAHRCPEHLIDLGCGTGVTSAAWAMAAAARPDISGIDKDRWALDEAVWNWRQLGLTGHTRQRDLVDAAETLARRRPSPPSTALVLGWSVNELDAARRARLLAALRTLAGRGSAALVIEPLARAATPWWDDWAAAARAYGGRVVEGRFDVPLPPALAVLDREAGFRRDGLGARALLIGQPASES